MSRFGLRRRLLLAVLATVFVVVVAGVAAFNLVLGSTLDRDARDLVHSRAAAQLASLRFEHGRLTATEAPGDRNADAYLWVFAGRRAIDAPRASADVARAAGALAGGPPRYVDVPGTDTRLYATPVIAGGKRVGTVVAGVSLAPYEQTRRTALIASLAFGTAVLLLVALAARWLLAASLRPVVRMTRQAAAWSEHDLDHRFDLGEPHDELTELAGTLDGLLDRLAASLRHERRFSAELSHELRTPLATILAESELALRRDRASDEYRRTLELVRRNAAQLSRTIDALVAAARYEAGDHRGTANAEAVAADAVAACSGLAAQLDVDLRLAAPPRPLRVGVDADLAERILQPVIENACRYAESAVRVSVAQDRSAVVYAIEDDGPGVAVDERERIFEPGVRGSAGTANGTGAGLGLALARRLARSARGDVVIEDAPAGARFVVRVPAG